MRCAQADRLLLKLENRPISSISFKIIIKKLVYSKFWLYQNVRITANHKSKAEKRFSFSESGGQNMSIGSLYLEKKCRYVLSLLTYFYIT